MVVVWVRRRRPVQMRNVRKVRESNRRAEPSLPDDVQQRAEAVRSLFGASADVVVRTYVAPNVERPVAATFHVDGMVDVDLLARSVTGPLAVAVQAYSGANCGAPFDMPESAFPSPDVRRMSNVGEAAGMAIRGHTIVILEGDSAMLVCNTAAVIGRAIEEPTTESTVRGSKEGFVENLRTNTALIRRSIADPRLRVEETSIGRTAHTKVAILYVDGIANPMVLTEVRERLAMIDVDALHESGHLEELIEDAPYSILPTMMRTERPDRAAGALLEGRVILIVDGTPFVLIVPVTFTMFLTTSEDYFERFPLGTVARLLRIAAFALSMLLPALYVAVTTFHQEALPTPLILSIAAQREGIPFPAVFEALIMELTFEVVREAGIRLPRLVGPAVSIVGVLVLGDAAIRSGLVSPIMVIVVAGTGVASFATPSFSMAIGARLLRFAFLFLAAILGLYGIAVGLFAFLAHLTAMESFGVPFMEPLAPVVPSDLKDSVVRAPWWAIRRRPESIRPIDSRRAKGEERR